MSLLTSAEQIYYYFVYTYIRLKYMSELKNKQLLISLTIGEHSALMEKAKQLKISASQLIRQTTINLISYENENHNNYGTKKG